MNLYQKESIPRCSIVFSMNNQFNLFIRISLLMKADYQGHIQLVLNTKWYLSLDNVLMRFEVVNDEF